MGDVACHSSLAALKSCLTVFSDPQKTNAPRHDAAGISALWPHGQAVPEHEPSPTALPLESARLRARTAVTDFFGEFSPVIYSHTQSTSRCAQEVCSQLYLLFTHTYSVVRGV